jgi:AAA domain
MKDPLADGFHEMVEDDPLTADEKTETPKANGHAAEDARHDVEERLHNMRFGADGINNTLTSWTASGLCQGETVESLVSAGVAIVQDYAAAHPEECGEWKSVITGDWSDEKYTIASMCFRFINKRLDLASALPDYLREGWHRQLNAGNLSPRIRGDWQRKQFFVEGETPRTEAPPAQETPARKQRFKVIPFRDLRPGLDPACVVEELIPLHGIVCVWGKPKCLKTFWLYDLCFHVALALEYRGRQVQQGNVVYCAFEGAHGFGARTEALRRCHGLADDTEVPIFLVPGRADLIREHEQLVVAIKDALAGKHPTIVALDTLNKSLVGSENKPEDMAGYVRAAEAIREAFDCVVIIVHHCGWDEAHPRGHSSLPGAVDAELSVTRSDKLVTVTVQLMKDGPEGVEIRSEVEKVTSASTRTARC